LLQQLVSELKVNEGRHVEYQKFYVKVQGREVQWQRKLQFIAKEGEGIAGVTESSQDLAGKVNKTCKYVKQKLRGDGSKGGKHDPIISRR